MTLKLYNNKSEPNAVTKNIELVQTLTGTLKNSTSIIDPVIVISDIDSITNINYCKIDEFNRYYYIKNIRSINNNLWEISCHVDVLFSFADGIRAQSGIVERQENLFNLYLNDGNSFQVYQNPQIATIKFPNGFENQAYVIAIAGS